MKKQAFIFYPLLLLLLFMLFAGGLVYGAVSIPVESVVNILLGEGTERLAWQNIVLQSRFPQAVTALLALRWLSADCCYRHCSETRLPVLLSWGSVTGPIWESLRSCSISAVR